MREAHFCACKSASTASLIAHRPLVSTVSMTIQLEIDRQVKDECNVRIAYGYLLFINKANLVGDTGNKIQNWRREQRWTCNYNRVPCLQLILLLSLNLSPG
jgi:hypothetical protein